MIIFEDRAATVLYKTLKSLKNKNKFLLPLNICPIVPDTFIKANINFEFVGEETTIDRSIADKLAEPLLHMIKNSISHGVEDSEERIENGKNAQGKIKVEA